MLCACLQFRAHSPRCAEAAAAPANGRLPGAPLGTDGATCTGGGTVATVDDAFIDAFEIAGEASGDSVADGVVEPIVMPSE